MPPMAACAGRMPMREKGGRHDDQRRGVGIKPAHHQHVDEEQHPANASPRSREDFIGHVHFTVPLETEA